MNDLITIVTPDGSYSYRVDSMDVVNPERTDVLEPSDTPTLTMITCYPFGFIGNAPKRFVVRARQLPSTGRYPPSSSS